jgi:hypothetical protein
MHLKSTLILCATALILSAAPLYAETSSTEELKDSSQALNHEWKKTKEDYKVNYKTLLEKIDERMNALEGALDNGDAKERSRINEELADLGRMKVDIKQIFNELTASSAVKFGNVRGDIKDAVDDMKD